MAQASHVAAVDDHQKELRRRNELQQKLSMQSARLFFQN